MIRILRARDKTFSRDLSAFRRSSQESLETIEAQVREIVKTVRARGDHALLEYTSRFDRVNLAAKDLKVAQGELEKAWKRLRPNERESLTLAKGRIEAFHCEQRAHSWIKPGKGGGLTGQVVVALERVGVYVPGGKASYPSSVLMNTIPAQVAGVKEIVMVTPPSPGGINPFTLAAAKLCGVHAVYRLGGAQAIAALAYGTDTIPRVDKIVGPGNAYVAVAKKLVAGEVGIDMVAGPSEILVVADQSARPEFIAADLLSQAEHDEEAKVILVTPSPSLAKAVQEELASQCARLPRQEILRKSLERYGCIIVATSLAQSIALANDFAPEHLLLSVQDPFALLGEVKHAGSVFLGHFSPVATGDYLAGPNHVLPTSGTARFYSPLGVHDFLKSYGITYFTREQLQELGGHIQRLARIEGLEAHARSVEVRLASGKAEGSTGRGAKKQ